MSPEDVLFSAETCQPPSQHSRKEPKDYKAKSDEATQDEAIPPLLIPDPLDQAIDSRNLTSGADNPAIDIGQRLPLEAKVFVNGIGLAQDAVGHAVAVVDTAPLLQHVFGLCVLRILAAVGVDVAAHVGQEVCAVARRAQLRLESVQLLAMLRQNLPVAREVCRL